MLADLANTLRSELAFPFPVQNTAPWRPKVRSVFPGIIALRLGADEHWGGLAPAPAGLFCFLCLYLNLDLNLFLSGHHRLLHRPESRRVETEEVDSSREHAGGDSRLVAARCDFALA